MNESEDDNYNLNEGLDSTEDVLEKVQRDTTEQEHLISQVSTEQYFNADSDINPEIYEEGEWYYPSQEEDGPEYILEEQELEEIHDDLITQDTL